MADDTRKLKVFISYSRDDLAFADQLVAALKGAGFDPKIDRTMPGGEEWEKRLVALIRDADSVVFVLSPSSVSSKWCRWEVDQAVERGKRILPALCRPLEGASPPPQLAARNYMYFYAEPKSPGSDWGTGIEQLASALKTDLDWLREHTRYLQRAEEWAAGGRAANRLLSGPDIEAAKAWASSRPANAPDPTELQRDFIKASETEEISEQSAEAQRLRDIAEAVAERGKALAQREEAQTREAVALAERKAAQTRFTRAAIAGFVVAAGFLAAAAWQYSNARVQSKIAQQERGAANQAEVEAQSNAAQAKTNAEQAMANADRAEAYLGEALKAREDAETAKRDALEARDRMHAIESRALASLADLKRQGGDATTAALLALEGLPSPGEADRPYTPEPEAALYSALYDVRERAAAPADGRQSVSIDLGGTPRSIDLHGGGVGLGKRDFSAASKRRVKPGQGEDQLLLFDTSKEETGSSDVMVADLGEYRSDVEWGRASATFSPDGSRLLASGEKGIIWNAITGTRIAELKDYEWPAAAAFSADNKILATTATLYDAKNVELWNPQTGRQIKSFPAGHSDAIRDVALSRDGKTLVTCAPDGSLFLVGSRPISIWDTKTWQPVTSLGIDGVDISPDMVTADGAFLITHDDKKTVSQVWDLRFPGSPGTVQTMKRSDGAPLPDEPSNLGFTDDDTLALALPVKSKRDEATTDWVRFSARTGAYIGYVNCDKQHSCGPLTGGISHVISLPDGFEELDPKNYRVETPHQLTIDTETAGPTNRSTRLQARLDLGQANRDDIQRISVDARRKLIAAEVSGNRLLLGGWDANRFASDIDLGESSGWMLTPRGDRLGILSLRRLTIVDLKGRLIAKYDGNSITQGVAGINLISYAPDFSEIAAYYGERARVFRLYPDVGLLSEAARDELPRCLTLEQRAAYGLSPAPPDWCLERGKWPFDTPEWKTWLSKRKQDPTTPLPAR